MSATLATIVRPEVTTRTNAVTRIFSACRDAIARHVVHRAATASLHKLDDRALRDIGIARCQIEAAVRGLGSPDQGRV